MIVLVVAALLLLALVFARSLRGLLLVRQLGLARLLFCIGLLLVAPRFTRVLFIVPSLVRTDFVRFGVRLAVSTLPVTIRL